MWSTTTLIIICCDPFVYFAIHVYLLTIVPDTCLLCLRLFVIPRMQCDARGCMVYLCVVRVRNWRNKSPIVQLWHCADIDCLCVVRKSDGLRFLHSNTNQWFSCGNESISHINSNGTDIFYTGSYSRQSHHYIYNTKRHYYTAKRENINLELQKWV
jgi:hypothetical protein